MPKNDYKELPTTTNKDSYVGVRMSAEQKDWLLETAEKNQTTVSSLIIHALDRTFWNPKKA